MFKKNKIIDYSEIYLIYRILDEQVNLMIFRLNFKKKGRKKESRKNFMDIFFFICLTELLY